VSHPLLEGQILSKMQDRVRWMVFKVKQRAENNYYNTLEGSTKAQELLFGYNWPYDYFSMIEFAKIDSTVHYGTETPDELQTISTSSSTLLPNTLQSDLNLISTNSTTDLKNIQDSANASIQSTKQVKKREPKK
jgi:hypothetical protein